MMHARRVLMPAVLALALVLSATAFALADDYAFEPLNSELKMSDEAVISIRLVHKASGKPVPDAVIFARRLDMAPDGMATMTAPLEALPQTEAGVYRFKTDVTMTGNWQLSLAAKIQGEAGTQQTKIGLKVTE
jgi:hypothetical protein